MITKISRSTYSGGDGSGDPTILMGFYRQSPYEIVKEIYRSHSIYIYRGIYNPLDINSGDLIIAEFSDTETEAKKHNISENLIPKITVDKLIDLGISRGKSILTKDVKDNFWKAMNNNLERELNFTDLWESKKNVEKFLENVEKLDAQTKLDYLKKSEFLQPPLKIYLELASLYFDRQPNDMKLNDLKIFL